MSDEQAAVQPSGACSSSDPSREWPHYYPDPPILRCLGDHTVLHEGDEWKGCDICNPADPGEFDA